MAKDSQKLIANNKKAYHDYFVEETYECGIALHGTEVKSIRAGQVNLKDSFASVQSGEVMGIDKLQRTIDFEFARKEQ